MTLIIPEGYAQFVLRFVGPIYDSGNAVVTFGMGEPIGPTPTPLLDACEAIHDAWQTYFRQLTDSQVVLETIQAIGAEQDAELVVNDAGLRGAPSVPPNVACLVRKVSSGRGRRRQGRMFWPSILSQQDVTDDGLIAGGALDVLRPSFLEFHDTIVTTTGSPVVILQNEEGVSPPISPPPGVSTFLLQQKVATQRRRLRS